MTQLVDRNGARIADALTLVDDVGTSANFYSTSVACGPASCLATWNANGAGVSGALLAADGTRRSENRILVKPVSIAKVIIAPAAGGTFRLAQGNHYVFIDAAGALLADMIWLSVHAEVAGIAGGRIFYTRVTAPEELLGSAMRLFAREEPGPPRMRPVAH